MQENRSKPSLSLETQAEAEARLSGSMPVAEPSVMDNLRSAQASGDPVAVETARKAADEKYMLPDDKPSNDELDTSKQSAPTLDKIRESGYLDTSFDGKEIHQLSLKSLPREEALQNLQNLNSSIVINDNLRLGMPYNTPVSGEINIVILNFGEGVSVEEAEEKMEKLGLRAMTFEEFVQFVSSNLKYAEQGKKLIALGSKNEYSGSLLSPSLIQSGSSFWMETIFRQDESMANSRYPAVMK